MGHPGGDTPRRPGIIAVNTMSAQSDAPDYERAQSYDEEEEPVHQFPKRESASPVELFYDLWFVANLNVFTTLHPITDVTNLGSFIRFFLMLWITWLATTVFDVRFGQDGLFERIARACHLTVMLGFSAGGVSFSQTEQLQPIFKVMSLCLMCSRFVLAIQYGVVLITARRNRRSRNNLALAVALHLVPAFIYMGATIASATGSKAKIDHLWWAVALAELVALMAHATLSKSVTFGGTHLTERLNLLTLIVIGEGIIILAKTISKIVQYTYLKDPTMSWSSTLFGLIACGAAILYFTFQLYFDWMDHHSHMSPLRQALWTILHLPFHIALVLTVEGSGQWITTRRAFEANDEALGSFNAALEKALNSGLGAQGVFDGLEAGLEKPYKMYTFSVKTVVTMGEQAEKVLKIPDSYWKSINFNQLLNNANPTANDTAALDIFGTMQRSLVNAIFNTYGLTTSSKAKAQAQAPADGDTVAFNAEDTAYQAVFKRLNMIFIYAFVAAGSTLLLLSAMHLLQKPKGWSVIHLIRLGFLTVAGVALCLVALVATNDKMADDMIMKPWQLPIMAAVYLVALLGSHLPNPRGLKASHSSQVEMGERDKPSDTSGTSPYHD
ncbi:hypothetical protein ACHAPT_009174 [Fusarium lateritium]